MQGITKLPEASGIYRVRCIPASRDYVGSSSNIRRRIARHVRHLRAGIHHNTSACHSAQQVEGWSGLQQDWTRYGAGAFTVEVLELTADLVNREQYWIAALGSSARQGGYNLAEVVERTPGQLDWTLSEQSREKIRQHPNLKAALVKSRQTQEASGWAAGRAALSKMSRDELSAAGRKGNRAGKSEGARKLSRLAAQAMGWNYRETDEERATHWGFANVADYIAARDARNAYKAAKKRGEQPETVAKLRAEWQRHNAMKVKAGRSLPQGAAG